MGRRIVVIAALSWVSALAFGAPGEGAAPQAVGPQLPFSFVQNQGQWPEDVAYQVRAEGMLARIMQDAISLRLRTGSEEEVEYSFVRISFQDGAVAQVPQGQQKQAGKYNFFLGSDPESWRTQVPGFDQVTYADLYPGIDLRLRGEGGVLEYDVLLAPGASLDSMVFCVEGIEKLAQDEDGNLIMTIGPGTLTQPPPRTWQVTADGESVPVDCQYHILNEHTYGFAIPDRNPERATVIDPSLKWSTLFGGSGSLDRLDGVAIDKKGIVVVAGSTNTSSSFWPLRGGYSETYSGGDSDAILAKFNPKKQWDKQLVECTYLGGELADQALAVHVAADGTVTAVGWTDSLAFPTTADAFQAANAGGLSDLWVARLDSGLSTLQYSTYLGGSGDEGSYPSLHVDSTGILTLADRTTSWDFPTSANAWSTSALGAHDGFISRLDPSLLPANQLLYSTYFGSSADDAINAMVVDNAGIITLAGPTGSPSFPVTTGAFSTTYGGGGDGFLSRLDPTLAGPSQLLYSTYLGGNAPDHVNGLDIDANGVCVMTGPTMSQNFPTTPGAFSTSYNGGTHDAFVTQIAPNGSGTKDLLYSTYLGGTDSFEYGYRIVQDSTGGVTVVCYTDSTTFPTTPYAFDSTPSRWDTVVSRLSLRSRGAQDLVCSTYLGDSGYEIPWQVALDAENLPVVVGRTSSFGTSFPTTDGAFQQSNKYSWYDGFVTKFMMVSWSNYGSGWPGTNGSVPKLTASDYPVLGSTITIDAENTSGVNTVGFLLVGTNKTRAPVKRGGMILVVPDLMLQFPVPAAGLSLSWSIPDDPALCDQEICMQLLQSDPGAVGKISMTRGLHLILGG